MKLIQPTDFCKINEIMTDKSIFIIPNFQRPYVWGERQLKDLFNDLEKASDKAKSGKGFHYLSAIHVLELQTTMWVDFIDRNTDCLKLETCNLDSLGNPIPIYAIVDGQQRLTTIFLLIHVIAKTQSQKFPNLQNNLFATLQSGVIIPRLIQSPSDDHLYMQQMLADYHSGNNITKPESAAQRKFMDGLELIDKWASKHPSAISYLLSDGLQTSVLKLESHYGLTSFLTLNDRGKQLTILERLKALMLQAVFETCNDSTLTTLANRLHSAFGRIYKILDKLCHIGLFHDDEEGDREMVKLFSSYLRLDTDAKSIWQGGDAAYEDFFRYTLSTSADIPLTLTTWLEGVEELAEGLEYLNSCLTSSSTAPSIFFPGNSNLVDDYNAIFLSLGLQPHLLALLIKFRILTKVDWHTRFPIITVPLTALVKKIDDYLHDMSPKTSHSYVLKYINKLQSMLKEIEQKHEISMLEVVERLQILNWNLGARWYETFKKSCKTSLGKPDPVGIISYWFNWCGGHDFLDNVLNSWNDTNFRYLTRELERSLGQNIHKRVDLQLEHILPQNPDDEPRFKVIGGYTSFAYVDKEEYTNQGVWRSGNLTWLTASCNASIGNSMPDDKAAEYISCVRHIGGGFSGSSHIKITKKVGAELIPIGLSYGDYRWFISSRCAELASFSLVRFI